jgi:IrrE N-terminal-like domain
VREAPERLAEQVLGGLADWIWDGETLPVPVEHIADTSFGLFVRDVEDLTAAPGVPDLPGATGLSGLLLPSVAEIWVNAAEARDWPPRRRFTIGHELGHWCMHRGERAIWCRAHAVDPQDRARSAQDRARSPQDRARSAQERARSAYPREESEANRFAATLLMPAHLVRRHYERLRRRDPDGCFGELCRIFGTSGAAMSRRLRQVI